MSERFFGNIKAGATGISVPVLIRSTGTSAEAVGLTSGNMSGAYVRNGESSVKFALASLTGGNTVPFIASGFLEIDSTILPGLYRLDVPNAAWATGTDWTIVSMQKTDGSTFVFHEKFNQRLNKKKYIIYR